MNLKKIVSAASALTIAASAFASMAVTANAAEPTNIINTNFGASDTDELVNTDAYTWGTGFVRAANDLLASKTDDEVADGGVIRAADGATDNVLTFTNALTGNISISFDMMCYGMGADYTSGELIFKDSKGNKVFSFRGNVAKNWNQTFYLTDANNNANDVTSQIAFTAKKWNNIVNITVDTSSNLVMLGTSSISIAANSDIKAISLSANKFSNLDRLMYLDDLKIDQTASVAKYYDYSVNYVCDSDSVYSATGTTVAGTQVTAESRIDTEDGQRYYIIADAAPTFTVSADGPNQFEVPVRVAKKYNVSVTNSFNDAIIAESAVLEGDSFNYAYPKYLTDENDKVIAVADKDTYSESITANDAALDEGSTDTITKTVAYKAYTGTAYAVEAEDVISGSAGIDNENLSGGKGRRGIQGSARTVLTVPENGVYTVTYAACTSNYGEGKGGTVAIYKNDDLINSVNVDMITVSNVRGSGTVSKEQVELYTNDKINVSTTQSTGTIDYVIIEKTGDIASEKVDSAVEVSDVKTFTTHDDLDYTVFKALVKANDYAVKALNFENKDDNTEITEISKGSEAVFVITYEKAAIENPTVKAIN